MVSGRFGETLDIGTGELRVLLVLSVLLLLLWVAPVVVVPPFVGRNPSDLLRPVGTVGGEAEEYPPPPLLPPLLLPLGLRQDLLLFLMTLGSLLWLLLTSSSSS